MVAHAHEGGCQTVITTNFTFGRRSGPELVQAGLDHFRISIDAATAETYQGIRGGNFFADILAGIRVVQDENRRLRQRTPYLGLEFVMTRQNIRDAPGPRQEGRGPLHRTIQGASSGTSATAHH